MDTTAVSVELGSISRHQCACCHQESETVHGFLYDRAGDTAVYFAGFTRTHESVRLEMVISLGGWGENTGPADRLAVPMRASFDQDSLQLDFVAPESSPWFGESYLGGMAEENELTSEDREAIERLARFAIEGDPRIASYVGITVSRSAQ